MSDISQYSTPPKIEVIKENKTDFDFENTEKKDIFITKRIIRYVVLVACIIFAGYILILFALHLWNDENLQIRVINKIIDNIVVIIGAISYILGINFLYKK